MGIYDQSSAGSSSGSNSGAPGVFRLKAGTAIAKDDVTEMGPDGIAWPVQVTDYAAVGNSGQIVAKTTLWTGYLPDNYTRLASLQGRDGSLYFLSPKSGTYGLLLSRYSPGGAVLGTYEVDPSTSTTNHFSKLFQMPNGNIVIVDGNGTGAARTVVSETLGPVLARTVIGSPATVGELDACALTDGGFLVAYSTRPDMKVAVYDNNGATITAPLTAGSLSADGNCYVSIRELSDKNVAIACSNTGTTFTGVYHEVVSKLGAVVNAFAVAYAGTGPNFPPELSVLPGYYAIGYNVPSSGTERAKVFNNASVLQGGEFSSGAGHNGNGRFYRRLINDGTQFLFVYQQDTSNLLKFSKLPVTGAGFTTYTTGITRSGFCGIDAFCERGKIVAAVTHPSQNPAYCVIDIASGSITTGLSTFGTGETGVYYMTSIIPGGDFSFVCAFATSAPAAQTNFYVGKYANSAIAGVAQATAAADAFVTVAPVGIYSANKLKGSPAKAFDHSATNLVGNKGSLMTYGASLKGF